MRMFSSAFLKIKATTTRKKNAVPIEKALNPVETAASPAGQANTAFKHRKKRKLLKGPES